MSESSTSSGGGVGVVGLLTVAFVVLKLLGEIAWSWWWVLSPIWITVAGAVVVALVVLGYDFVRVHRDRGRQST